MAFITLVVIIGMHGDSEQGSKLLKNQETAKSYADKNYIIKHINIYHPSQHDTVLTDLILENEDGARIPLSFNDFCTAELIKSQGLVVGDTVTLQFSAASSCNNNTYFDFLKIIRVK